MAENVTYHGSWVGDTAEEFKKLPTWGKILAGIAFIFVAYYGYSQYRHGKATQTSGSGTDTTASNQSGPMIGNVPVIPAGYNPVYNPTTGELQGYQPPTTTSGGGGGGSGSSSGGGGLQGGNPPVGGTTWINPLIPHEFFPGGKFPTIKGQPNTNVKTYTYLGTTYNINPGTGGRIWGTPVGGGQGVLLYGPPSQYHNITSPFIVQAGGQNGATPLPSTRLA